MSEDNWCTVVNKKKHKRKQKLHDVETERTKWRNLQIEYPHIIMPVRAQRIRRKMNIEQLDVKLMSDDWIQYQKQGWRYVKVLKPDDPDGVPESTSDINYSYLELNNKWGDKVIFCQELSSSQNGTHICRHVSTDVSTDESSQFSET